LRHGKNQNVFSLYKLRTMQINSDIHGNTVKNDQRIYSFAKILRKFRLDELPQMMNIIRGDMHLVGPRAEWVKLSDKYSENIDNYILRNVVRPGITGWAQVLYQYGFDINDSKQKLMYELYYIKNWTVWLELEICIKTIFVILDKKGF
jgi:lipopolysaccharide/colanic/teichoic acid biosynthesis glycosyltransferase